MKNKKEAGFARFRQRILQVQRPRHRRDPGVFKFLMEAHGHRDTMTRGTWHVKKWRKKQGLSHWAL